MTKRSRIVLVAALDRERVIGNEGALPWRLPDDMKHFKALTLGKPVVMGRKTFDSMKKPLAGRTNIVLSRRGAPIEGCLVARDPEEALGFAAGAPEVCIIGGAEIYTLFLPLADRLELTLVDAHVEGDVRFPEWRDGTFERTRDELHPADEMHAHALRFTTWERRAGSA